jgi:hypothetical protein
MRKREDQENKDNENQSDGALASGATESGDNTDAVFEAPEMIRVVWLKNVRHHDGLHRKNDKSMVTEDEAKELIANKLVRLPE